jgi:hypothetical protein
MEPPGCEVDGGGSVRMQDVRLRVAGGDVALISYAALAGLCRPLTLPAAVAVAVAAIALVAPAAHRRPPPRVALGRRHVAPWAVLMALLATWEATAALWGNNDAHPTLSLLLDPVLATYPGRVAGWLAWLGVGRWLVTR